MNIFDMIPLFMSFHIFSTCICGFALIMYAICLRERLLYCFGSLILNFMALIIFYSLGEANYNYIAFNKITYLYALVDKMNPVVPAIILSIFSVILFGFSLLIISQPFKVLGNIVIKLASRFLSTEGCDFIKLVAMGVFSVIGWFGTFLLAVFYSSFFYVV